MGPLVSVIVPVYNAAAYLNQSITSIIEQTYSNLEIILVNDGSDDCSSEICKKFSEIDKRIKFIDNIYNNGQSHARNCALEIMTGEYLCFVDSDDSLISNAIEVLVNTITSKDADIVGFNANSIKNMITEKYVKYQYGDDLLSGEDYLLRMLELDQIYDVVWLYFYRTRIIRDNNIRFIENRIFEDEIWVPEVFLKASCASYIDFCAYNYFLRPQSTMTRTDINEKKYLDTLKNCHKLEELAESINDTTRRNIFKDYIARMYMSGTRFIENEKNIPIEYSYIRKLIHTNSTRLKYCIFRLSRNLYFNLKAKKR